MALEPCVQLQPHPAKVLGKKYSCVGELEFEEFILLSKLCDFLSRCEEFRSNGKGKRNIANNYPEEKFENSHVSLIACVRRTRGLFQYGFGMREKAYGPAA